MLGFHKQMDNRIKLLEEILFFFLRSSRHANCLCDVSSDVCSSDLTFRSAAVAAERPLEGVRRDKHTLRNRRADHAAGSCQGGAPACEIGRASWRYYSFTIPNAWLP